MNRKRLGFHIVHVYSLWQDLSVGTKIFDPVTLTSNFDLLLKKKLNLGIYFWTERDWASILRMCIPCGKTFLSVPKFLTPWPWPPTLTYFWKNLTLAFTFEPKEFILCMFIPCGQTFLSVQKFLIWWPWPPSLTYFWKKNLFLALNFEQKEILLVSGIKHYVRDLVFDFRSRSRVRVQLLSLYFHIPDFSYLLPQSRGVGWHTWKEHTVVAVGHRCKMF